MEKVGYIYILTNNNNNVLYIGVTSNLTYRLNQHRTGYFSGSFTCRYNVTKLVYFEKFDNIEIAIAREKQLKGWARQKKINLIAGFNPGWVDINCHSAL